MSKHDPERRQTLQQALQAAWEQESRERPAVKFETVFLLDPTGMIVALVEPSGTPKAGGVVGQRKPNRDYFRGAQRHWRDGGVHVSRAFRSDHDHKDKIALSLPVHPGTRTDTPWVLAATLTTQETLGLSNLQRPDRKRVLLVRRDPDSSVVEEPDQDGYRILVHPWFKDNEGKECIPFPSGRPRPLLELDGRPELQLPEQSGTDPFAQHSDYRDPTYDPAAGRVDSEYAGRWLAGSARVGNSELLVVVQQRYSDAVVPQQRFLIRLLWWFGGVLAVALVAFAVVRLTRPRPASGLVPEK